MIDQRPSGLPEGVSPKEMEEIGAIFDRLVSYVPNSDDGAIPEIVADVVEPEDFSRHGIPSMTSEERDRIVFAVQAYYRSRR